MKDSFEYWEICQAWNRALAGSTTKGRIGLHFDSDAFTAFSDCLIKVRTKRRKEKKIVRKTKLITKE